jgi:hypothetical protein
MRERSALLAPLLLLACEGGTPNEVEEGDSRPATVESTGPDPVEGGPSTDWVGRPIAAAEPVKAAELPPEGPVDDAHNVYCTYQEGAAIDRNWWTFSDRDIQPWGADCVTGTSDSYIQKVGDLSDPNLCAVTWTGNTTATSPYGFAGLGVNFSVSDWSGADGFVLAVRGDGGTYRVELPMGAQMAARQQNGSCGDKNQDPFGMNFRCGDGTNTWKEVKVPWSKLGQSGWGNPLRFDPKDMRQLHVRTTARPVTDFRCDVYVKDILLPAAAPAKG